MFSHSDLGGIIIHGNTFLPIKFKPSASPYRIYVMIVSSILQTSKAGLSNLRPNFLVWSLIFINYKEEIMYHIKEAAELSGVSVKTLHHYDKIGLLVPVKSENGYRTYSQEDLERLQVILYYKYLGFSLDQIAELCSQRKNLTYCPIWPNSWTIWLKKATSGYLDCHLAKTIQEQKGERKMTIEEKFTGFSYQDNQNTTKKR